MRNLVFCAAILCCVVGCVASSAPVELPGSVVVVDEITPLVGERVKTYHVARAAKPPVIDGVLQC